MKQFNKNQSNSEDCIVKKTTSCKLLVLNTFWRIIGTKPERRISAQKNYSKMILKTVGLYLLNEVIEINRKRLLNILQSISNQSQTTNSRNEITFVPDKTSDGPRHGKGQRSATRQYTGSHGVIRTHGWLFLIAVVGNGKQPECLIVGAHFYKKKKEKPEWKIAWNLIKNLERYLFQKGFSMKKNAVAFDAGYSIDGFEDRLHRGGFTFVGKAGGPRKVEIEGVNCSLAEHRKRNWGKYQNMSSNFINKTNVKDVCRIVIGKFIYLHIRHFPKYEKRKYPKKLLVTNKKGATRQWIVKRYEQRWAVESVFRSLKQNCDWNEYHPHSSGQTYENHTGIVIALYSIFQKIRLSWKGFRHTTNGIIRRLLVTKLCEIDIKSIFISFFEEKKLEKLI